MLKTGLIVINATLLGMFLLSAAIDQPGVNQSARLALGFASIPFVVSLLAFRAHPGRWILALAVVLNGLILGFGIALFGDTWRQPLLAFFLLLVVLASLANSLAALKQWVRPGVG